VPGGKIALPRSGSALVDRRDGGHLIVEPEIEVWERSELSAEQLFQWSCLVAATGQAMLQTLAQLEGGCINYWEAGNWSLNDASEPRGFKDPRKFRRVHLHLLGRSPRAQDPDWKWGEAPRFPSFADRERWTAGHTLLEPAECVAIVRRVEAILGSRYHIAQSAGGAVGATCRVCQYPIPQDPRGTHPDCSQAS
jgi:hypothetical protein